MTEPADEQEGSGLRILCLDAQNVKRLKAVHLELDPAGGLVIIGGRNAAGKTSVLDSILYALGGERAIPAVPIREGETRAEINVDLGFPDGTVKFRITRSITPKGNYLKLDVPGEGGLQAKAPQKLLDGLLGALTFDPLAFTRMKPAEQRAALLDATGLSERVDEIGAKRKQAFEERTLVGRQLKQAEGHLKSLPEPPKDLPAERVDVAVLMQELEAGEKLNRELAEAAERYAKAELAVCAAQVALAAAEREAGEAAIQANAESPDPVDVPALRNRISHAGEINQAFDAVEKHKMAAHIVDLGKEAYAERTASIEDCDEEKAALLRGAELPIEGLGCNEDGVTFEDLPLDQAASSVRLRVSAAIGMALNPKLKVMRIEDGSLLDGENLTTLAEMASSGDFQIWIERVGGDDPGAIIIEDGSVAE